MAHVLANVLAVVSVLLSAVFLLGVLRPDRFVARARRFVAGPGPGGAVAIRVVLAGLLWLSAPVSATPDAFRGMGLVVLAAAVAPLMLGAGGLQALLDRMARRPSVAVRLPCAAGLALASFMLWSVSLVIGGF